MLEQSRTSRLYILHMVLIKINAREGRLTPTTNLKTNILIILRILM